MKKLLLGSVALIMMSAPVLAADMPVRARPAPAPVWTWSGCYFGVNVGYAWAKFDKSEVTRNHPLPTFSYADFDFDDDGVTGGLTGGCNWQTGIVVWGIETDFQLTSIEARSYFDNAVFNIPSTALDTDVRSALRWFGTFRGRVGWTISPETMVYFTGGLAYGLVDSNLHFPLRAGVATTAVDFDSNTHVGYTVGIGAEAKIARNFSAKLEYLYVDLGSADYGFNIIPALTATGVANFSWNQRVDLHVVRVGLNYQFDWGYTGTDAGWGLGKGKGVPAPVVRK